MERPNFQPESLQRHIVLPDGSNYHWSYLQADTNINSAISCVEQLMVRNPGQEIRLVMDNPKTVQELAARLEVKFPQAQIGYGRTTFFECSLSSPNLGISPGSAKWEPVSCHRLNTASREDMSILHDLMTESFAHEKQDGVWKLNPRKRAVIEDNFHHVVKDPRLYNSIYLVKQGDEILGSFTLLNFPALGEVQLHAVAGRTPQRSGFSHQEGKLRLLMQAAIAAAKRKADKLTFSSSGAAHLYAQLGFTISPTRDGVAIRIEA